MKRNNGKNKGKGVQKPHGIELDGYETASSVDDFNDAFDLDEEDELDPSSPIFNINITELSEFELTDVQIEDTEDPFKSTELVLKFSHKIKPETVEWFIRRVTSKKSQGGAELMLRREPFYGKPREGLVVHITAACWRQLEVAEMLEIKKTDYSKDVPVPREFKIRELQKFLKEDMENHQILTAAEKQMVILHELQHLHCLPGERVVPGYRHIQIVTGESLFHVLKSHKLIDSYFALHDEEGLKQLSGKWFWEFFSDTPYEEIRSYFGDGACLQFNFTAYYSLWLIFPTVIGMIIQLGLPQSWLPLAVLLFCLINMVFLTLFLIYWQRYQSILTFKWGTLRMNLYEEPRADYKGTLGLDPITGKLQRRFPYIRTFIRTYVISFFVITVLCAMAIWAMAIYLVLEDKMKARVKITSMKFAFTKDFMWKFFLVNIPGILYACIVIIANKMYRWLAKQLTEWENHRTETQYERHLVLKMVVFEVTNNFALFFYTAFILRDMDILRRRLLIFLVVIQLVIMIDQCVIPIILERGQKQMHNFLDRQRRSLFRRTASSEFRFRHPKPYPGLEENDIEVMDRSDPRVEMSKIEGKMQPYNTEADFDDYLGLFLQFGYIFLFSSVFPAAAFFAFVCDIMLLSTGLFKRCEIFQRPIATRVHSIGAWQSAFEFMAIIAVMTNCALIGMNLRSSFPQYSDWEWIIICFAMEHLLISVQFFIKKIVPKVPYSVKVSLASLDYHSKEALKREQARNTRRRMTKVFRPLNAGLQKEGNTTSQERQTEKPGNQSALRSRPATWNRKS